MNEFQQSFAPAGFGGMASYGTQQLAPQWQQALQAQQTPFGQQGWYGNALGQTGQPQAGVFGQSGPGQSIGGGTGQIGRFSGFDQIAAYHTQSTQQAQQTYAAQQYTQLQQILLQHAQLQQALEQYAQLQHALLAQTQLQQVLQQQQQFGTQVPQALRGQQAQPAWYGSAVGQFGQPATGITGNVFGQSGIGQTVGATSAQPGRFLPFNVDPVTAAYAQQAEQVQQAQQMQQAIQNQQLQQQALHALLSQQGQQVGAFPAWQAGQGIGTQVGGYGGQYVH